MAMALIAEAFQFSLLAYIRVMHFASAFLETHGFEQPKTPQIACYGAAASAVEVDGTNLQPMHLTVPLGVVRAQLDGFMRSR